MNFFILCDPMNPAQYSRFSHLGTWSEGEMCSKCGQTSEYLIEPLQIEWDPGTEKIGDFSWRSYTCIVRDRVRGYLEKNDYMCRFGKIEFVRESNSVSKRPRPPYPNLSWLIASKRIRLNEAKSDVELEEKCSKCGQRLNRFKREGLFVDRSELDDAKLFSIAQFNSNAMFITDTTLQAFQDEGFTNLCPRLAGKIG